MCRRFSSLLTADALARLFDLPDFPAFEPRFSIAPTQQALVVCASDHGRQCRPIRWGPLPSWPSDLWCGCEGITIPWETMAQRPLPLPLDRAAPCLVPASGYYAWSGEGVEPWYITTPDRSPIVFAGLLGGWRTPGGARGEAFIIITGGPRPTPPYRGRRPLLVGPEAFQSWLDCDPADPRAVREFVRADSAGLTAFRVGPAVFLPAHDAADCIEPLPRR